MFPMSYHIRVASMYILYYDHGMCLSHEYHFHEVFLSENIAGYVQVTLKSLSKLSYYSCNVFCESSE